MASKRELQDILKDRYGINKNISDALSAADCEQMLALLEQEPSALKLVEAFAEKNLSLGRNNAQYGQQRSRAERKLEALQVDYQQLEQSVQALEQSNAALADRKQQLDLQRQQLEAEIQALSSTNLRLESRVGDLSEQNVDLTEANTQLKKDNKELKNIVDLIKLRLTRDTKELLKYEDSELRKMVIRLFRWTLG